MNQLELNQAIEAFIRKRDAESGSYSEEEKAYLRRDRKSVV